MMLSKAIRSDDSGLELEVTEEIFFQHARWFDSQGSATAPSGFSLTSTRALASTGLFSELIKPISSA